MIEEKVTYLKPTRYDQGNCLIRKRSLEALCWYCSRLSWINVAIVTKRGSDPCLLSIILIMRSLIYSLLNAKYIEKVLATEIMAFRHPPGFVEKSDKWQYLELRPGYLFNFVLDCNSKQEHHAVSNLFKVYNHLLSRFQKLSKPWWHIFSKVSNPIWLMESSK